MLAPMNLVLRWSPALAAAAILAAAAPALAQEPVAVATQREADGTTTMTHEALVDAVMPDVWAAISTAEGWMTWAVPIAWISADDPDLLETSYDRADTPGSASTIQQRFLARIPGRLLAFRTIKAPEGFPHWDDYRRVTSVFELETVGERTRVRLTSTGYPDTAGGHELITFFERGNAETLEALRKRFAGGAGGQ
jgi:hypothetical protein